MISEEAANRIAAALERIAFAQEQSNEIAALPRGKGRNPAYLKPMCLRCYPMCFREFGHPRDEEEKGT